MIEAVRYKDVSPRNRHTHTHVHRKKHTHTYTHICRRADLEWCDIHGSVPTIHTHTHTHVQTHTYIQTHLSPSRFEAVYMDVSPRHANTNMCTHIRTRTRTCTRTHTCRRADLKRCPVYGCVSTTHTHTHSHTRTFTYTLLPVVENSATSCWLIWLCVCARTHAHTHAYILTCTHTCCGADLKRIDMY